MLVALSGGPDSLALAAATAFEAPRPGMRAGAVDRRPRPAGRLGATSRNARPSRRAALGLDPVRRRAGRRCGTERRPGGRGPHGALRGARCRGRRAGRASRSCSATPSTTRPRPCCSASPAAAGPTSLQGMAPRAGLYRAAAARHPARDDRAGLRRRRARAVERPAERRPAFTRVRVRQHRAAVLERELGPGVAEALARTAEQLREDADALDHFAEELAEDLAEHAEAGISLARRGARREPGRAAAAAHPAGGGERVRRVAQPRADPRGRAARHRLARAGAASTCPALEWIGAAACSTSERRGSLTELEARGQPMELARHRRRPHRDPATPRQQIHGQDRRARPPHRGRLRGPRRCCSSGVLQGRGHGHGRPRARAEARTSRWTGWRSRRTARARSRAASCASSKTSTPTSRAATCSSSRTSSTRASPCRGCARTSRAAAPASVEICALLRKPEAAKVEVDVKYVGFDIPNEFVVGYGLDYAERYRNLRGVGGARAARLRLAVARQPGFGEPVTPTANTQSAQGTAR